MDLISRYVDTTHWFWSLLSDLAQNTPFQKTETPPNAPYKSPFLAQV